MRYHIQPITDFSVFTTPPDRRRPNPFSSDYDSTLRLLGQELDHLGAEEAVVGVACQATDLRRDGMLKARAKVEHPGVRLSFESKHGPLVYATDVFAGRYYGDPPDWQINLRAIALGLEALRKVDRYGVVKRGEQYAGFKALPAGRAMPASSMTAEEARRVLVEVLGDFDEAAARDLRGQLRRARILAHPDKHSGDRTLWNRVEQAAAVLERTAAL